MDIFGGHHQNGLDWFKWLFLCSLGYFLKVNVQNGDIFGDS